MEQRLENITYDTTATKEQEESVKYRGWQGQ